MKKIIALSAIALLAAAGSASAQTPAALASTLEFRIVPIDVVSASPRSISRQGDNVHDTVGAGDSNRTRSFEVQYRIIEGAGFEGAIASLASLQFNILGSVSGSPLSAISYDRDILTAAQSRTSGTPNSSQPVTPTDASGNTVGTFAGITGLARTFRGGLSPATSAGNSLPSNGTITPAGITLITPLTLSQLNQQPANDPAAFYGLYSFTVTVGDANPTDAIVTLSATPIADAQTQNAYGVYEDGDVIPRTGRNFIAGSASFTVEGIPAPGAMALLGLGGLVATRRRRA